tara:strand:+ start:1221 stop:1892 length:672 start_codon:yes stop_codon:yes gene_type:complete
MSCNTPINRQGLPAHFKSPAYGNGSRQTGPANINYNANPQCPQWRAKTNVFDDPCSVNVRENQSIDQGDYHVTNFFRPCGQPVMTQCQMNNTLTYPKTHGIDQCNIDRDTDFRYPPLTNLKNVQQLFSRPYVSQGYRGAGSNNVHLKNLESGLIQGNAMREPKGCKNTSEVYIDRFDYLDARHPQQLKFAVEPWVRGGILTKDLVRRLSYEDYCHMLNKPQPF